MKVDGSDFQTLAVVTNNADAEGYQPEGVILVDGVLYGATEVSNLRYSCTSSWDGGTLFAVDTNGSGFVENDATETAQTCSIGIGMTGGVIYNKGAFYFATRRAPFGSGSCDQGEIESLTVGGTLSAVYNFTCTSGHDGNEANSEDSNFQNNGSLIASGNVLYGTTAGGGAYGEGGAAYGDGTIFSMKTNTGSAITILHNFGNGTDGLCPVGSLTLIGNTLYGVTYAGGTNVAGYGTIYSISTNGANYTVLHSFEDTDGAAPAAGLTAVGDTLYGTTLGGGSNAIGTVFSLNINGTGFHSLYSFKGSTYNDGQFPEAPLIYQDDVLYGTTTQGGSNSDGVVFAFNLGCPVWDWWKGDETLTDSGTGMHNGTASGSLTYSLSAISGESFDFNGSSTYVNFGATAGNFGTNDFVVDLWVNTTSSSLQAVLGKRPVCGLANMWDIREASGGKISFVLCADTSGTDYTPVESISTIDDGKWHEVTAVRQGRSIFLYVDQALEAQATAASVVNISNTANCETANDPCIAAHDGTQYFDGLIDEIRFMALCK